MIIHEWLETVANIVAILTGGGAAWAYGKYRYDRWRKKTLLESYLKSTKGPQSPLHLMAALALTEADVLQAAFDSHKIKPRMQAFITQSHPFGNLLLEYVPANERK